MGFFSKKNNDIGFIVNTDDETPKITGDKNLAPHAMTADEVSSLWVFGDDETNTITQHSALDSLKKRMNIQETAPKTEKIDLPKKEDVQKEQEKDIQEAKVTQADQTASEPVVADKKTLVERVKRYTIDEQGRDVSENREPLYQLESVAEILMNSGEKAIKNLSQKYGLDVVVDDLGKDKAIKTEAAAEKPQQAKTAKPEKTVPTPAFEQMVNDAEQRESQLLYESLFPSKKSTEAPDISVPDISDIDAHEVGISSDSDNASNTATIRFTPIKDNRGNTDHISISSMTKHIDLGDAFVQDISSHSSPELDKSEFDSFLPDDEFVDCDSGKKILRRLAIKKRSCFLSTFISFLSVVALSVFLIPPVYNFIMSNPKSTMFTCSAFLFVSFAANINMLADFKGLFKKRCQFDVLAFLCSLLTLALGISAALTKENAYYIIFTCAIILFVRALLKFKETSTKYANLKQISTEKPKNAVTLISDTATTFAMAKNTIEGDVLVAAHKKAAFVEDFVKHYDFSKKMSGKLPAIFYATAILSFLSGIMAYFYYDSIFYALYSAACIACIAAMPSLFFIDTLPLSSACKRLNRKGAMIAGLYGAERIETANAAVVSSNDIFPEGAVTMHNMKVLSNNNIDEILLRAASLTDAVGSPLAPIFKKIAGTNSSYSIPDSDTVKYEKNLGISGWVDNELLFIGNRSLMLAHGIEIPSLEVDKKILRQGYFPVYVATSNTACALVIIQYGVSNEVAKELHRITELGVMLLIENCDPNITEEMICDYFGLYDDSVKIMTNAGVHMYKNATPDSDSCSAPAAFRGKGLDFVKIINCASGIKRCNRLLTIIYTLFAVLGAVYFVYASFSGLMAIPSQTVVLGFEIVITFLSIIGFLIRKP